ncbi:ABZJ_00895 family protein [Arenibacterium sp. CAU 1754]
MKRYAVTYVAALVGLIVLNQILFFTLNYTLPTGLSIVFPAMAAALREGQKLANDGVKEFSKADAWRAAGKMTLVAIGINAVVFALVMLSLDISGILEQVSIALLAAIFVFLMALTFFVNRFFLMMGFGNQRKLLDKQAIK